MLSINIKRSVGALAVTAGLLAAGAPASHAFSWNISQPGEGGVKAPVSPHGSDGRQPVSLVYDLETVLISGFSSGATHPGSSAKVLENTMISGAKATTAKGSGAKVQVQDVHFSTKAKGAKGKRGKGKGGNGKPTHTYDIQSNNHV